MVLADEWVEQLYVDPSHTGEGVGSELLAVAKSVRPGGSSCGPSSPTSAHDGSTSGTVLLLQNGPTAAVTRSGLPTSDTSGRARKPYWSVGDDHGE